VYESALAASDASPTLGALANQVRHLSMAERPELRKLTQLREEHGELSVSDDKKYRSLVRATERDILQVRP